MRNGRFHPPKCRGKVQKTKEETFKRFFSNLYLPIAHPFGLMWSTHAKVNVSIPVPDPYPCPTIASISDSFSPICAHACFYFQGCNQCKCMTWLNVTGHYSLHGNGCNLQTQIAIYNDLLWKFISNSYYFRKIYFLRVTSLHLKFYMPIFLWDVESSPNYTEKLIFAGIGTITLLLRRLQRSHSLQQSPLATC
jgi:hypothetical protein